MGLVVASILLLSISSHLAQVGLQYIGLVFDSERKMLLFTYVHIYHVSYQCFFLRAKSPHYYGERMAGVESSSPFPMASLANVTRKEMDLKKDPAAHQKGFVEIL